MIYPIFFVSMLTILVGLITIKVRFNSIKSGELSVRYFKLMTDEAAPEIVIKTTRCFNNMFEIPVLFYVVCTLYITLEVESNAAMVIAWLFFIFRFVQAFIHITYNNVKHRALSFAGSVLCVCALWGMLMALQV